MPDPTFVFSFIVATLLGAIYHLIVGGDARRLALFLLVGWVGFAVGHIAGSVLDIRIFDIGRLHIVPSVIGALFALIIATVMNARRGSQSSR